MAFLRLVRFQAGMIASFSFFLGLLSRFSCHVQTHWFESHVYHRFLEGILLVLVATAICYSGTVFSLLVTPNI